MEFELNSTYEGFHLSIPYCCYNSCVYLQTYNLPVEVIIVACHRDKRTSLILKATSLLEVITEIMMKPMASWTQQVWLSGGKCQLLALFTVTTRSNDMGDIYKLCRMSASSLKPTNKRLSGKEEDLVKSLLEGLRPC